MGSVDLDMLPMFLLIRDMVEIGWFADRPENATPQELEVMKAFVLYQCNRLCRSEPLVGPASRRR